MSNYIDLKELVDQKIVDYLLDLENDERLITKSLVRNKEILFSTQSKRQLWQAVGLEYIEPELLDYIDSIPEGSIYFDIGASNGIFLVYAAISGLNVIGFEPESQNYGLLEKNCFLNNRSFKNSVRNFNIAISDSKGIGEMHIAKFEAAGHMKILDKPRKVQSDRDFNSDYVQSVIKYDLDTFIEEYQIPIPNYIKIDVDGSEMSLINGAKHTIRNKELKGIFIELDSNLDETNDIINKLSNNNFKILKKIQVQNYEGLYNYIFAR